MKKLFSKLAWIFLKSVIAGLVAVVLISCGTAEPTSTSTPTASPNAVTTIQEPAAQTTESAPAEEVGGLFLPTATPAPTATPGMVAEMISEFTEAQGLEDVTVFQVRVEDWLNLGFSILLILIFGFVLARLVYYVSTKIVARTASKYDDLFLKLIRVPIYVILITFGFQVGTARLSLIEAWAKIRLDRFYTLIYVLAATVIVWHMIDVVVKWYQNEVEPKRTGSHQVDTLLLLLHRVAKLLLIITSLIMVLSLYNINVTALVAALGVGGLAISLAAQDTLSNVISGIMIMTDQPFRVGDRIEIPKLDTWGDVVDIGLRSTRIRTRDNRTVIVPNNIISTDQVVNYSYPDSHYRIQFEIGIAYGQDVEQVRRIIVDAVRQVDGVLPDRPVDALYVTMSDVAMIFRVRWWLESYVDTRYMFDRVNTALQKAFDEAGIELAIAEMDINILDKPGDNDDNQQNPHESDG